MQQKFDIAKVVNQLPVATRKQIAEYIAYACKSIVESKVKLAYTLNASKRGAGNFVSLEELLSSISVVVSHTPVAVSVFIDENKVMWEDKLRKDLHSTSDTDGFSKTYQEYVSERPSGSFVNSATTLRSNKWVMDESLVEIQRFINTDLQSYLRDKIKIKK